MHAAIIVVDMVRDTLQAACTYPIAPHARALVPTINELNRWARDRGWPVIFACDSFMAEDFIFRGKLEPHSLRGTPGSEPADELERNAADLVLPKRRFSAFFKTDLDQTLRTYGVDTVCVCGISTHFCVLTTAMDAVCHDFSTVILEDATAAPTAELRDQTLALYRKNAVFPLLRVLTVRQLREEIEAAVG